jgi:hypothetical protein
MSRKANLQTYKLLLVLYCLSQLQSIVRSMLCTNLQTEIITLHLDTYIRGSRHRHPAMYEETLNRRLLLTGVSVELSSLACRDS